MRVSAQLRLLPFVRMALFVAAMFSVHSGLAAQQTPPLPGPRLGGADSTARIQQRPLLPESPGYLAVADRAERAGLGSVSRGVKIGAAIGCAVGGVLAYRNSTFEGTQRVAWAGGWCVALAIPGALLGAVWAD